MAMASSSFSHALMDTFERLSVGPLTPELRAQVTGFAHMVMDHPIEFLPEVPETLEYLSDRHRLILVTKGALAEQGGKIERSGLKGYLPRLKSSPKKILPRITP